MTGFENSMEFVERVILLKKRMLERKLSRARTNCTIGGCEGTIVATLAGRKNHVHARCDTCNLQIME